MQIKNSNATIAKDTALASSKDTTKEAAVASQNKANQAAQTSKPDPKTSPIAEKASATTTKEGTSTYLKVLSRLEGMAKEGKVNENMAKSFSKAMNMRLNTLSDTEKSAILKLKETKAIQVTKIDELSNAIIKGLQDKKDSGKIFSLLKHPRFAEFMDTRGQKKPDTYSPQSVAANSKNLPNKPTATATKASKATPNTAAPADTAKAPVKADTTKAASNTTAATKAADTTPPKASPGKKIVA